MATIAILSDIIIPKDDKSGSATKLGSGLYRIYRKRSAIPRYPCEVVCDGSISNVSIDIKNI